MRERTDTIARGNQTLDTSTRLASLPFLTAVAVLLLNDRVLKGAVGNWFTGKLSDFAGLFAFSFFWAALFPSRRRPVFALTAIVFVLWKTPLSDPALAAWNALGIWPLARVVDYSDWIALVALIPAYHLTRWVVLPSTPSDGVRRTASVRRRLVGVAGGAIAVLAFSATSIARPQHRLPLGDGDGYSVNASRVQIRAGVTALGLNPYGVAERSKKHRSTADTVEVHIRQPPERHIGVTLELRELTPVESRITLLTVSADGPVPKHESVIRAFEKQVMEPLRIWLAEQARSPRDST